MNIYRGCGTCGAEWAFGATPTCTCTDRVILVPKREWVGLTEHEKDQIHKAVEYSANMTPWRYANEVLEATEAKLKEKNT